MELQYREMRLADIQSRLGVTDVAREIRSRALLAKLGVKLPPSPVDQLNGKLKAWECVNGGAHLVGHCTGDSTTGEILHLLVGSDYEGQGIGRKLLALTVASLRTAGAKRIWLAATSDPTARAYGFYRAVGWRPTGERTRGGEEILELPRDCRGSG
jgi:ribosomal protein S18 acetylase RimI-like enzyme